MLKIEILADLSDVQIGMFSVERDKIRNPFYYFIFIWASLDVSARSVLAVNLKIQFQSNVCSVNKAQII